MIGRWLAPFGDHEGGLKKLNEAFASPLNTHSPTTVVVLVTLDEPFAHH